MVWIQTEEENKLTWFQRFAIGVIKCGPVPNHVAFIMDGNRRFATKNSMRKAEGHAKGFEKLSETLQWCLEVGIREVTVYAFSIENFKRTQEEVDTLMGLAREKFKQLLGERDRLHEKGICIRVVGNLKLLPLDMQKTVAEAILMTKDNKNAILNVAFAYTSRDEIADSVRTIVKAVDDQELEVNDIDEELITNCMYTKDCTDPDLLVRTSGEVRLSDFLLWQVIIYLIFLNSKIIQIILVWNNCSLLLQYPLARIHAVATLGSRFLLPKSIHSFDSGQKSLQASQAVAEQKR